MKLDAITLSATMQRAPKKKIVAVEYPYCDVNAVEERGLGIMGITITGVVTTLAARDTLEQACEAAGVKKLYFPSEIGQDDDRYYNVYTQPAQMTPAGRSATVYNYTIECLAADPAVYYTATDTAVW